MLCMCACLCLCVTYLHLDLHTAVREPLDHAVNPYERLHLSHRERERTSSEGRARSWTASPRHTSPERHGGKDRDRDCVCTREAITLGIARGCAQQPHSRILKVIRQHEHVRMSGRMLTEPLFVSKHISRHGNWALTFIYSHIVYFLR